MMTINKANQINRNIGLYIHLPFCQRKCSYCGFLSLANQPQTLIQQYLTNLLVESNLQFDELERNKDISETDQYIIDTIYIGGGTPSLINGKDMITLLEGIRKKWPITETAEITMESNPNSLTAENMHAYLKAGVNRLSIGVQSFDDAILEEIGRLHDAKSAVSAVGMAKDAGFANINIDLMFGLPGQTLQQWEATLHTAVSLEPTHLSLYTLQIEEGTKLYHDYKADKLPMVDLDVDRACYHYAINYLKSNGYNQYEISNFAKENYVCKHNLKYWSLDDFLGIGINASSCLAGRRWRNLTDLNQWTSQIENRQLPIDPVSMHQDSFRDAMGIFVFTGLRKKEGISLEEFKSRFGVEFFKVYADRMVQLKQYQLQGQMDWSDSITGRVWITEAGIDHSNEIMSEFV